MTQTTMSRKQLVVIEGNISSSKTTILRGCREAGFAVFEEPLDVWKERYVEKNGDNILGLFYANTPRWAFTFEVGVMHTRFHKLLEALSHPDATVILERSLWTDAHVFEPLAYASGNMTDMEHILYRDWYECFMKYAVEPLLKNCDIEYIFIDTPPEECFRRKQVRDRLEESAVVPEYFAQLHERHHKWLLDIDFPHRVQVVDGSKDQAGVLKQVLECMRVCVLTPLKLSTEDGAAVWSKINEEHRAAPVKPHKPARRGALLTIPPREERSSDDEYHDDQIVYVAHPNAGPRADEMRPAVPHESPKSDDEMRPAIPRFDHGSTGC